MPPSREPMLVMLIWAILIGGASVAHAQDEATSAHPNIVYILADDMGQGDVQCMNPKRGKIATLHLNRLASQGMVFTDAHSGSSVCTPTRYGLLTGRYAWRTRLQKGVISQLNEVPLIAANRLTVPAMLGEHGYHSAAVGKWHLGFKWDAPIPKKKPGFSVGVPVGTRIIGGPTTRGFDEFFGFDRASTMSTLIENNRVAMEAEAVDVLPLLTERAVQYIGERADAARAGKPFFLYFALSSPHTPIVPSAAWRGKSGIGLYGDFVMQTDAVVGQVVEALEKYQLASNTLVIFTADNGCSPHAGTAKELEPQGHFASGPYRGYKADIWEGGHRVPFIARWPGKIEAGTSSDQITCLTDLMATCAQIVGASIPDNAGEDSVSILPAMLGEAQKPIREAVVHHSISGKFAIRRGPWKLALCPGSGGWSSPRDDAASKQLKLPQMQLYNLANDPAEQHNLINKRGGITKELLALVEKYVTDGRSMPGATAENDVAVRLHGHDGKRPSKP